MKIVADTHIAYLKDYFGSHGELILKPGRHLSRQDIEEADLLLVRAVTPVNKTLLAGTKVKFVGSVTTGTDHLDTAWLEEAGIFWSDAGGFNAAAVADYVYCTAAAFYRETDQAKTASLPFPFIGKKAAVIGAGRIGQIVTKLLKNLGFNVEVCDPLRALSEADFYSTPLHQLHDLDFITVHVPLMHSGPHATYDLINEDFLQRQKQGCVLVNTSRGAVFNTQALLRHAKRLHYALDVWKNEPHINLALLERAWIATPHIAGYSVQSKMRGTAIIYQAACEKKILTPLFSPLTLSSQSIIAPIQGLNWASQALRNFDPLILTQVMKNALLSTDNPGQVFDKLRHELPLREELR